MIKTVEKNPKAEKTPAPAKGPSILSRGKPAEDIGIEKNYLLKALIGGGSGSGKSQCLITIPRVPWKEGKMPEDLRKVLPEKFWDDPLKPILEIDYDNRAAVLAGEPGIYILTLFDLDPNSSKAWRAGEKLRKELWAFARLGEFPFSAVCEDSLTMMGNIAMNHARTFDVEHLGLGGSPGRSHWLPQIHFLRTHINSMRMLPCHYILTCHMEPMQDDATGAMKFYPKVTRSLKPEIPTWFNETYYCRRKESKDGKGMVYYWITKGTQKYDLFKSTLNQKGKFWKDPIRVNLDKEISGFQLLFALRFGVITDPRLKEVENEEERDFDETDEVGTSEDGEETGGNSGEQDKT